MASKKPITRKRKTKAKRVKAEIVGKIDPDEKIVEVDDTSFTFDRIAPEDVPELTEAGTLRKKLGRMIKLSPDVQEKIVQAIKLGATQAIACKYAGITPSTFIRWVKRGIRDHDAGLDDTVFTSFAKSIQKAEGSAAVRWLAVIEREATGGQWTAAAWKLERRYPQMYGRMIQQHDHIHRGGVDVKVSLDKDDVRFVHRLLAEKRRKLTGGRGRATGTDGNTGGDGSLGKR